MELESQNLLSVVETRRVTFFVDLHSANLTIMYPWAIEANGRNPDQTFLKGGFRRCQGWPNEPKDRSANVYSEYFPDNLLTDHMTFAGMMRDRILQAAGRKYQVGNLASIMYPAERIADGLRLQPPVHGSGLAADLRVRSGIRQIPGKG